MFTNYVKRSWNIYYISDKLWKFEYHNFDFNPQWLPFYKHFFFLKYIFHNCLHQWVDATAGRRFFPEGITSSVVSTSVLT